MTITDDFVWFSKLQDQIQTIERRLLRPVGSATAIQLRAELEKLRGKRDVFDKDIAEILQRIEERHSVDQHMLTGQPSVLSEAPKMPTESRREFLIRTGKITPFAAVPAKWDRKGSTLQDVMLDAEESGDESEKLPSQAPTATSLSHQNLRLPGFMEEANASDSAGPPNTSGPPTKRRRLGSEAIAAVQVPSVQNDESSDQEHVAQTKVERLRKRKTHLSREADSDSFNDKSPESSGSDSFVPSEPAPAKKVSRQKKARGQVAHIDTEDELSGENQSELEDFMGLDDGNERVYKARLHTWSEKRSEARQRAAARHNATSQDVAGVPLDTCHDISDEVEEWFKPHPTVSDADLGGGFRIPGDIYRALFDYQKTGVQWLWELYQNEVGGIVGDEMGLGKTIQVIAFLAGLHYSGKFSGPVIVVTPATVMKQWVNEFHRWWPPLRVSILHGSGSGMLNVKGEEQMESRIETTLYQGNRKAKKAPNRAAKIVETVLQKGHVLVTTYAGLQTYGDLLIPVDWGYAVLDEGHKIRNPNTSITIYCKELRTPNRVILSGTPIQNNLTELWSLFDFVFPMRLGTLVNFRNKFEIPIKIGGYASASNLQVQTAMKCAETLKDAISPYLLQRLKLDVASDLPKKSERVLFCQLTEAQRKAYEDYLESSDVRAIIDGSRKSFAGIELLRKICNHPDLVERDILLTKAGYDYGSPAKSGKMQVVKALLELWKKGSHKTLLFAQQKIMLNILEKFMKALGFIKYRRMDGDTPIEKRQALVDEFNNDPSIDVFLLTTKVGGLGVNLTGADRVIIFDPDWNPSTDTQARERAWRLGQKREVTIYRLMMAGTIEEKIYHRQLFKQFLTNKILKDPKLRQNFLTKDLHDLFTLGPRDGGSSETGRWFDGTETKLGNGNQVTDTPSEAREGPKVPALDDTRELRNIAGVAGLEDLVNQEEEEKTHDRGDRIVDGILAGSGVSSTVEHEQIVNGKIVVQADPRMIEQEAKRIAAEAAKELKRAGEAARNVPIGVPTWTGQVGEAGRPSTGTQWRGAGRGGPSSLGVLAGLQARQTAAGTTGRARGTPEPTSNLSAREFVQKIQEFMNVHGGEVRTQMIVDHFNRYCKKPAQVALFKEVLAQMATLQKTSRMRGKWVLKDEYRTR